MSGADGAAGAPDGHDGPAGPGGGAGPRIEVVGGGRPDPAELAALTVALTPARAPSSGPASGARELPAWTRAARLEGVGHRRAVSAPDLAALRARGGSAR